MDSGKIHLTVFQCKFCQITLNIVSAFRKKKPDKNESRKMQINKDEIGIFVMKESEF